MNEVPLKNENWQYYGMFLDNRSQQRLFQRFESQIPADWKRYGDHMTVIYNDNSENARQWANLCEKQVGTTAVLMGVALGVSDRAIAIKVLGYQSNNAIPHITIAVAPGARPVESNQITNWVKLEQPIYLNSDLAVINKPRSQWK